MSETIPDRIFLPESLRGESTQLAGLVEALHTSRKLGEVGPVAPQFSPEFTKLVSRLLNDMASGRTVTVGALPDELTTTVAAEQLGVSRGTLMKWIESGELPSRKQGTHTRVSTADVLDLRRKRTAQQRKALEELLALEDELGLE